MNILLKILLFPIGGVVLLIICMIYDMLQIFILSVYGSIKWKTSFRKLWAEFYGSFIKGIKIGLEEIKN